MSAQRSTRFLQRRNYRLRRFLDLVKMMPVLGALFWLVPLLWTTDGSMNSSMAMIYIFAVWIGLVVAKAMLSGPIKEVAETEDLYEAGDGLS